MQCRVAYNATYYVGVENSYVTFSDKKSFLEWYTKNKKNVSKYWVDTYYYVAKTIFKFTNLSEVQQRETNTTLSSCNNESEAYNVLSQLELVHGVGGTHVHVPE